MDTSSPSADDVASCGGEEVNCGRLVSVWQVFKLFASYLVSIMMLAFKNIFHYLNVFMNQRKCITKRYTIVILLWRVIMKQYSLREPKLLSCNESLSFTLKNLLWHSCFEGRHMDMPICTKVINYMFDI